jgi:hypothetical protein
LKPHPLNPPLLVKERGKEILEGALPPLKNLFPCDRNTSPYYGESKGGEASLKTLRCQPIA